MAAVTGAMSDSLTFFLPAPLGGFSPVRCSRACCAILASLSILLSVRFIAIMCFAILDAKRVISGSNGSLVEVKLRTQSGSTSSACHSDTGMGVLTSPGHREKARGDRTAASEC